MNEMQRKIIEQKIEAVIPNDVTHLASVFKKANKDTYIVGGCVRDAILGKEAHDFDLTTPAVPSEIMEILKKNRIGYTDVGAKFGTIVARLKQADGSYEAYEITSFRREAKYLDNRRPEEIEFVNNINEDLGRRDLTINAIAYDLNKKELVDPYNGLEDLQNNYLRAVGIPDERYKEDALRMIRTVRFAIREKMTIDVTTKEAIEKYKEDVRLLTKERITDELKKIFSYKEPIKDYFLDNEVVGIAFFGATDNDTTPLYKNEIGYRKALTSADLLTESSFEVRLASILYHTNKQMQQEILTKNLCLSNDSVKTINNILENIEYVMTSCFDKKAFKTLLYEKNLPPQDLYNIISVGKAIMTAECEVDSYYLSRRDLIAKQQFIANFVSHKDFIDAIVKNEECYKISMLDINGNDLMKLGLKGKEIGKMLDNIVRANIEEKVANNKESLLKFAKKKIERNKDEYER